MSNRLMQPDTDADEKLRELLDGDALPGFTMIAGAGSGKTTSLVKALAHLTATRGESLRRRTQQVACITYTEVAADEIFADVGSSPLTHVSTVHSFLWEVVKPFQRDLKIWVHEELQTKLADLEEEQSSFSRQIGQKRRDKVANDIMRSKAQLESLVAVDRFTYAFGPDLGRGTLGHEDVIKAATSLLFKKPLLAAILAKRFPFVFVDEGQDTFPEVVEALMHVKSRIGDKFGLGFFGDPMQKIYLRGIGEIPAAAGWVSIEKPENFRSPARVLDVMNHIRGQVEELQQVSGRKEDQISGSVYYFVLPADKHRTEHLNVVRGWLDSQSGKTGDWTEENHIRGAKILVIAHRMAARRLGFESLYAAFHDSGSSSLSQAFDEGTAWPARFMIDSVLPLIEGDSSSRMARLREGSPKFADLRARGTNVEENLSQLRSALDELRESFRAGGPGSVGAMLRTVSTGQLAVVDPRLEAILGDSTSDAVVSESVAATLSKFLECDVRELVGYRTYLSDESPYSTHQGVKGAEFNRVIVVLDDEEGRYNLFSYDRFLGLKPLSETDLRNAREGKESVVDRTRRLLYVCISRSMLALAVILYAHDVRHAVDSMKRSGLPGIEQLMVLNSAGEVSLA